jgi:hypothetical protein
MMWSLFRDVFEVDHIGPRSRGTSREVVRQQSRQQRRKRARDCRRERATTSAPCAAINNRCSRSVSQPDVRPRFKFTPGKPIAAGDDVLVVDYVEESRPMVIDGGSVATCRRSGGSGSKTPLAGW